MKDCPEFTDNSGISANPYIIMVGNMNVGKSTLFSRLCPTDVSNLKLADSTVSIKQGKFYGTDKVALLTPGIHSIFSANEDEKAARDILLDPEITDKICGILLVGDAKNMRRSIAIALQYAEYGLPMLLDVNMTDEAASRGIKINFKNLSSMLGIDVCTTIARENIGLKKIQSKLSDIRSSHKLTHYPDWVENFLANSAKLLSHCNINARAIGLLLLADDTQAKKYIEAKEGNTVSIQLQKLADEIRPGNSSEYKALIANTYNKKADQIVREIQTVTPPLKNPFLESFGNMCAQIYTGIPIAIAVMFLMYQFVGSFGATFLVDTINSTLFENILIPATKQLVEPIPSKFIKDMIVDPDFGVLPTGVFLALGLVLPVLFCFYIAFGLLEDTGYLPRLSILLDKIFLRMGLNGKGVIPLVMGFSCVTMAILTTRLLSTKKEKNIATFLLMLGMPCAPLIAVMLIILDKMPLSASIAVFGFIFTQIFIGGIFLNKILPGKRSPFIMEIPPMRSPKILQVIKKASLKTYFFMKEAVPIFIMASFLVFLFDRMGGLQLLEHLFRPLTTDLMGLPEKSVQVFIKTLIRRESGAAELEHLSSIYTNVQLVINLLVMTFLTPCLNSVIVLFKERGTLTASILIVTVITYAILIGTIFNHACRFWGITFT